MSLFLTLVLNTQIGIGLFYFWMKTCPCDISVVSFVWVDNMYSAFETIVNIEKNN